MRLASKLPGPKVRIYPVKMEFNYTSSFGSTTPEAYERLILDVMLGDPTLFTRTDEVESAWRFITDILEAWDRPEAPPPVTYPAGSWGPPEADKLVEADGVKWRRL